MRRVAGVLFARPPVLGEVKTRLARLIGEPAALCIYQTMLSHQGHLFDQLKQPGIKPRSYVYMALSPGMSWWRGRTRLQCLLPSSLRYRRQVSGNLGTRMTHCITSLLRYHHQVILWGGDIPTLQPAHIKKALDTYPHNCLVPTQDGGYALVSVSRENYHPDMMKNIAWSTRQVLDQQKENFERLGLTYVLTDTIPDVDEVPDLLRTLLYLKKNPSSQGRQFAAELATALEKLL